MRVPTLLSSAVLAFVAVSVAGGCKGSDPAAAADTSDARTTETLPDGGGTSNKLRADGGCGTCRLTTAPGADASSDGSTTKTGSAPEAGSTAPAPLGKHSVGVTMAVKTATGSVTRTYDITLPATCSAENRVPLVFVFHGDGGNGAGMYTGFPIEAAAAAAGGEAIFVYPDGTNANVDPSGTPRAWDLYHDPGPPPYAYVKGEPVPAESDEPSGNADVDFFDTMLETFEKEYCVDPAKVFITGMSSGGYLSNQFARWRSGVVKGTAPQSGGMPFGNSDSASGTWAGANFCISENGAVPALIIHGESDTTVLPCNGVEAQSYWELANGCQGSANNCTSQADSCTGSNIALPSSAPTTTSPLCALCQATAGCGAHPVVLCQVPGLGHDIWSLAPSVVWSFFAAL